MSTWQVASGVCVCVCVRLCMGLSDEVEVATIAIDKSTIVFY